jgi:hypothetical protein
MFAGLSRPRDTRDVDHAVLLAAQARRRFANRDFAEARCLRRDVGARALHFQRPHANERLLLAGQPRPHGAQSERGVRELQLFARPFKGKTQVQRAVIDSNIRGLVDVRLIALERHAGDVEASVHGERLGARARGELDRLARVAARRERPLRALALFQLEAAAVEPDLLEKGVEGGPGGLVVEGQLLELERNAVDLQRERCAARFLLRAARRGRHGTKARQVDCARLVAPQVHLRAVELDALQIDARQ